MDYRLNSGRLWGAAAQLYSTGPELFNPAVVAAMLPEQLHRDLYAGGVAGRFHQRNAKSWQRVTERLVSRDGSAVRRVIDEGIGSVDALRKDLKHFPSCVGKNRAGVDLDHSESWSGRNHPGRSHDGLRGHPQGRFHGERSRP